MENVDKLVDALLGATQKIEEMVPGAFETAVYRVQVEAWTEIAWSVVAAVAFVVGYRVTVGVFRKRYDATETGFDLDNLQYVQIAIGWVGSFFLLLLLSITLTQVGYLLAPEIPAAEMLIGVVK